MWAVFHVQGTATRTNRQHQDNYGVAVQPLDQHDKIGILLFQIENGQSNTQSPLWIAIPLHLLPTTKKTSKQFMCDGKKYETYNNSKHV